MSGFVGVVTGDPSPVDVALLQRIAQAMSRRGPDAQECWVEGNVGFAHALLRSTHEAANESQPLCAGGACFVGDVRLDRRAELIESLGSEELRDADDATLVLHAYLRWGESLLERISGDFAFGIWDQRRRELLCARDQFGVVPFFYATVAGGVIFGNDLDAIRTHPGVTSRLNDEVVADLLVLGLNTNLRASSFADVEKLPPSHSLTWRQGQPRLRRYWEVASNVEACPLPAGELVERFQELFERSVADRLRTQHVATHLSGGLDSTSVAVTAHRQLQRAGVPFDLRAYSIVYRDLIHEEEGRFAAEVSRASGFPVHYMVAEDFLSRSPLDVPEHVPPQPSYIPELVAEWEITRRAASFSRTLFVGFGGDPALHPPRIDPGSLRRFRAALARARQHRRLPALGLRRRLRRVLSASPRRVPAWIEPEFAARARIRERLEQLSAAPSPSIGMTVDPLWSNIFEGCDPGFSGLCVKFRFPFFDVRLVEFLRSVPASPWLQEKHLLREAMRGALPQALLSRPKTPLPQSPHHAMALRDGVPPFVRDLVRSPLLAPYVSRGHLDPAGLSRVVQEGAAGYNSLLFLSSFAWWLQHQRRARS